MAVIAFDVDGTLIDHHDRPRYDIIALFLTLRRTNTMVVWSGGGCDYAAHWAGKLGLDSIDDGLRGVTIRSKLKPGYVQSPEATHIDPALGPIDVAFDDEDASGLAKVWVPVR